MSDTRLLQALESIWEDLPALCGDRWPWLQQRLAELLEAYARASDDEERARISLEIQDEIERVSTEAAIRLYREMERAPRGKQPSSEDLLTRLRGYFPTPGPSPVPPVLYVCPVEGCTYRKYSVDPDHAGECPKHHVPLVRADTLPSRGAPTDEED